MPPALAFLLCCGFVSFLFWRDKKLRKLPSPALWIPAIWLTILGSRPISYWLSQLGIQAGPTSRQEGSPLDLAVFLSLILAAVLVLARRSFDWGLFIRQNKMLVLVYVYLALSAIWADYGVTTFKRVFKDFGCVPIALVLLTSRSSLDAIRNVYVRVAYLLFPFSMVFIKYFPAIGHIRSRGGEHLYCGVANHKNSLGVMLFVFGLMIVVDLMSLRQGALRVPKLDLFIRWGMLTLCVWLLFICDSVTSIVCFSLGCGLLWGTGRLLRAAQPKTMLFRSLTVIGCVLVLEKTFKLSGLVLSLLGRDATLTGRTEIWDMVKEHAGSLLGYGFYSFWDTPAAQEISALYRGTLNTVHNGFLEMYLDGGLVGLALLVLVLLVWARDSIRNLLQGTLMGRMKLTFLVLALLYNNSETSFFRLEPLWFTLLLMMINIPARRKFPAPAPQVIRRTEPQKETLLVSQ